MKSFDLEAAQNGEPIVANISEITEQKIFVDCVFLEYCEDRRTVVFAYKPIEFAVAYNISDQLVVMARDSWQVKMKPKKRTIWVNFYPDDACSIHNSEEEAEEEADYSIRKYGKAYPVEIEE